MGGEFHYQRDLELSEGLADHIGICRAYQNIGNILKHKGRRNEAFEYYEKSKELAMSVGLRHEVAKANENIGSVYELREEWFDALHYYEEARKSYESLGDRSRMARSLNLIGYIYYLRAADEEDLDRASKLYQKALDICQEMDDKDGIAMANSNLGRLCYFQDRYTDGLKYADTARTIRESLRDQQGLAHAYRVIGDIYYMSIKTEVDLGKSLEYFQKALNIYEALGDRLGIAGANTDISWVQIYHDEYEDALKYAQVALPIYEDLEDRINKAVVLRSLGDIFERLAQKPTDLEKSMGYYQQALEIYKEIQDSAGIANVNYDISFFYSKHADWSKALVYAEAALNIYRDLVADKTGTSNTLRIIGKVHEKRAKDREGLRQAFDYYQQALEISTETEEQDGIAEGNFLICDYYKNLGDYSKALEHYEAARAIWGGINDRYNLGTSYISLASIQLCRGNESEAAGALSMAEGLFREIKSYYGLAGVLKVQSELLLQQEKIDDAEIACQKGLVDAVDVDREDLIPEFYNILGRIHLYKQEWDAAKKAFDKGLAKADRLDSMMLSASLKKSMVELHMACGEKGKARDAYSQLVEFYRSIGAIELGLYLENRMSHHLSS